MNSLKPKYALYALLMTISLACGSQEKKEKTLTEYDLRAPDKFFMPESLFEISGITFNRGKSDTIYAIQDEDGKLFRMALGVKKQLNTRFDKRGDYEDLAIVDDQVFVLKSNGSLISFPFSESQKEEVESVREWKHLIPKGEYEGLYGAGESKKLYLLCKSCPSDDAKNSVSGFILSISDSLYRSDRFAIDVQQIKEDGVKLKGGFKPSGLAQNPLTKDWYIISSINKLIVVTDSNWKVKETCHLDGDRFIQPEGIAFDESGNLYISNEGSDISEGNILKFGRIGK